MTEVPLVIYSRNGNRQVIGTARVDLETGVVDAEVSNELWANTIAMRDDTSSWSYSTCIHEDSDGVVNPIECAMMPLPIPVTEFKGRIKLPESFKTPPTIEDHIILGEN